MPCDLGPLIVGCCKSKESNDGLIQSQLIFVAELSYSHTKARFSDRLDPIHHDP